ncbi:MAG: penicillin-binding protein 2, partial [Streptococcaceae bacterium]|nr:penicillin-binding protein 2 [Streptococcaceae bacterium]
MSKLQQFQRKMNKNSLGNKGNRKKVGILFFTLTIVVLVLFFFRLAWIVGVGEIQGTNLQAKTDAIYQGSRIIPARRGTIYDRYGNPIAQDATSYSLYAVLSKGFVGVGNTPLFAQPSEFTKLADIIHKHLDIPVEDALKQLNTNERKSENETAVFQVQFGTKGNNISISTKNAIEADMKAAELHGLYFNETPSRIYPNGEFASFFIGRAIPRNNDDGSISLVGEEGIEQAWNDILRGTDGQSTFKRDANGNPTPGSEKIVKPAVDGQDIYTTIDQRLQTFLETKMDEVNNLYQPETMQATLMDAKTGEILAISQRPSFNPDTGALTVDKPEDMNWRNQAYEDSFEPGSTMKMVTIAAAIEQNKYDQNATYQAGTISLFNGDTTINDWDYSKTGAHTLNFRQAFTWSSNVGMVRLWQMMGEAGLQKYMQSFLFGQSTNSGFITENRGRLANLAESPVNGAMSAFGQAMTTTNFQMMRAYSAFGNKGVMLQPQFISKIVDTSNNTARLAQPEVLGQPIKASTASEVLDVMRGVTTEEWGTARSHGEPLYYVNGMNIASKTGTAQIADDNTGKYLTGELDYLNSVVVMAPAEDPQFILYVTVKRPQHFDSQKTIPSIVNPLLARAFETQ